MDLPAPHEPDLPRTPPLRLRGTTFDASRPAVMAIINRTSDSFFADNRHADLGSAQAALEAAVAAGADIIDVGGVRAGQEGEAVSAQQEMDRVLPFLETARSQFPGLVLSLDTWRSEVALEAGRVGLDLVNDTWAGHDPELVGVAASIGAGVVCSHTGGLPPRTDPVGVRYPPGSATRSCRRSRARTSWGSRSTCPRRSGWRAPWPPPRSRPGWGRRSSGRTTSAPLDGWSTWSRSSVGTGRRDSPCEGPERARGPGPVGPAPARLRSPEAQSLNAGWWCRRASATISHVRRIAAVRL